MFVDSMAGAWKHAVCTLHAAEDRGGASTVAPPLEMNPLFEQVANAAAVGLQTHPEVVSARVAIHGADERPRAEVECVLSPSGDPDRIADLIDSSLLRPIETLLGSEFTAVDVRIRHLARRPAA